MKRTSEEFFKEVEKFRDRMRWDEFQEKRAQMFKEWYNEMEVGDHCHIACWSDVEPCTIIKRTPKTITVRMDKASWANGWKPEWVPGGFSAICTNIHEQEWFIETDPDGAVQTFRWSKRLNCFKNLADEKLYPGWKKYYDYNF